jgi:hypothetical protein
VLSTTLYSAPLLFALLLCTLAACRSAPPPPGAPQPPGLPTDGLPGAPDPAVVETRRLEEEIESPRAADLAPPAVDVPGTVVVGFPPGSAALGADSQGELNALVDRLRAARVAYPLELVATADGGEGERTLQRRRLDAVHDHLLRAGLAESEMLRSEGPMTITTDFSAPPPGGAGAVFVVVRQH